jgi:hypothetical protein
MIIGQLPGGNKTKDYCELEQVSCFLKKMRVRKEGKMEQMLNIVPGILCSALSNVIQTSVR